MIEFRRLKLVFQGNMALRSFVLLSFISAVFSSTLKEASVTYDELNNKFTVHDTVVENCVANGSFKNEIFKTGWSYLEVTTYEQFKDSIQAYAAGLVEGHLTASLINDHFYNLVSDYCIDNEEYCERLKVFLEKNLDFIHSHVQSRENLDTYWHQVALTLEQLHGIEDGFKNVTSSPSTAVDVSGLLLLSIQGDLLDLEVILERNSTQMPGRGSCSGLVKVLPDNQDIYFAHVSWHVYNAMLRILKKYRLKYHTSPVAGSPLIPGHTVSFSSQPSFLHSMDDYYLISTGLAVFETTIRNNNDDLWKFVKPEESLLTWQRTVIANRLATNGKEWVDIFGIMNSGTYNNQWNVLNYNKFEPGEPLQDGLLWTLEQLPGYFKSEDRTYLLRNQSYVPSYNLPYFREVFNLSKGQVNIDKYGDYFDYNLGPRALIFRRDHGKVVDVKSMIKLMRYNNYTRDPVSRCNCTPPYSALKTISARCDLNPANGTYEFEALGHDQYGGIDMKLTTSHMFKKFEFVTIAGPTHDLHRPFQWSTFDLGTKVKHRGHPDLWNFGPIVHKWS